MNVSLAPELEQFVNAKISSGLYRDASEVISTALHMMNEQEHFTHLEQDWLRSEIDIGWQEAELGIFVECNPRNYYR